MFELMTKILNEHWGKGLVEYFHEEEGTRAYNFKGWLLKKEHHILWSGSTFETYCLKWPMAVSMEYFNVDDHRKQMKNEKCIATWRIWT